MREVSVQLVALGKRFGARQLFSDINASVFPGECLTVLGANGSGKSTLLKMVAGLVRPSAGKVDISSQGKAVDTEQMISVTGLVSPELIFYHPLTACENISFFLAAQGRHLPKDSIDQYLAEVGLNRHHNTPIGVYSTGMKQRLKFALLKALGHRLVLLDEPSSNLDREGKEIVASFIHEALKAKKTLLLASNEPWETGYGTHSINLS